MTRYGVQARRLLLAALMAQMVAGTAWAHRLITAETQPSSAEAAIHIKRFAVSQVYYSEVEPERPTTWFTFQGEAGDRVVLSLGVPVIHRLEGFRPVVVLIGPGLPEQTLPFASPAATGRIYEPAAEPAVFHEHVTGTDSWMLVREETVLPETGRYYLAAYAGGDLPDRPKLWLSIGYLERFKLRDILGFFGIRRHVRRFHEIR